MTVEWMRLLGWQDQIAEQACGCDCGVADSLEAIRMEWYRWAAARVGSEWRAALARVKEA